MNNHEHKVLKVQEQVSHLQLHVSVFEWEAAGGCNNGGYIAATTIAFYRPLAPFQETDRKLIELWSS